MNNGLLITSEIATSTIASTAVASAVDASPLLTALITLGVSVVTLVGGELVKFLVTYLKKKTEELNKNVSNEETEEKKKGE